MNFQKLYNAMILEFNSEIAISAIQIATLDMAKQLKTNDYNRNKVIDKARRLLNEVNDTDFQLAVSISEQFDNWDRSQSLVSLGGVPKTFKQLLGIHDYKEITIDEFEEYLPIENMFDDNASLDGVMFETYGNELEYVQSVHGLTPNRVWTYVDGDDDNPCIISGFHFVNRIGYLITEKEFIGEVTVVFDSEIE